MRSILPRTLRGRLLLVALAALIPLVGLFAYSHRELHAVASEEWGQAAGQMAEEVTGAYRRVLDQTRTLTSILVLIPDIREADEESCRSLLEGLLEELPLHTALGVVDPDGFARCMAPYPGEAVDLSDRAYIQAALSSGEPRFSGFQIGRLTGNPVMSFARPIFGEDATVVGAVATGVELDLLSPTDVPGAPPGALTVTVFDPEGRILARFPRSVEHLGSRVPWFWDADGAALTLSLDSVVEANDLDGTRRVFAVRPLLSGEEGGTHGHVAVGFDPKVIRGMLGGDFRAHWIGLAVAGLTLLLGIWLVLEFAFLRRLRPVLEAAGRLGRGDLTARTGLSDGDDELSILGRIFDRMASNLQELREEEKARARAEIRERESRLQQLAEGVEEVFWLFDPESAELLYVSPAYPEIYGQPLESLEEDPTSWIRTVHPDDRDEVIRQVKENLRTPYESEYRVVHPDGSVRWIRYRNFPSRGEDGTLERVAGMARDVTERRRLEEALHQSEKMNAVGRLAGGVAHDFNNVLTAIQGHARLILESLDEEDPVRDDVEEIDASARRAADLTRQLLAFSRKQSLRPRSVDVNEVIRGLEPMLLRLIGEDIRLRAELDPDAGFVHVDPNQLEQALVNLAVNARDAMPGGGTLMFRTRNVRIPEGGLGGERAIVEAGRYVRITVADTGTGMDEKTLEHAFEPFFSTKEAGEGTGLGLASVYGIVKQSDGFIWVSSEPGEGASFQLDFPRISEADARIELKRREEDPTGPTHDAEGKEDSSGTGGETILAVEDEEAVLSVVRRSLERFGYTVIAASGPEHARSLFRRHADEIDLLLTDVVMPEEGGPELAAGLRDHRPDLPVLFMSGYPAKARKGTKVAESEEHFIEKPFSPDALARKIRAILNARAGKI